MPLYCNSMGFLIICTFTGQTGSSLASNSSSLVNFSFTAQQKEGLESLLHVYVPQGPFQTAFVIC